MATFRKVRTQRELSTAIDLLEDMGGGPTGPQGPQGDPGPAGADGADGKTVLNGSGAPGAGLGVDGDFYIDTTADAIYGPKTAGAWGSSTSLVGPTGPAGADGADGATGATGPQGPTGPAGADGADGADGKTVLNGSGAPGAGLGTDGDFYIDTTADAIYGPKTAGAWGSATSLVGPTGATGPPGAGTTYGAPALVLGTAAANGSIDEAIRRDSTIVAFDTTNPTTSAMGDAAAVGTAAVAARRDHKHARESFATPAIVLGTAAAAGAATTPIRSDSTIVAFDATAPTTQAFGDAAATGSAAVAARRDHKHAMPANPVTYGTPAIVLGTAAAAGASADVIRKDATIVAFDTTVPSTQAFGDAAAVGTAAVAARRDHKHAMPASPAGPLVNKNRDATGQGPGNTTTETDLYSVSCTSTQLSGRLLVMNLGGTLLNNSGAARTVTFKAYVGATEVATLLSDSIPANASVREWKITVHIDLATGSSAVWAVEMSAFMTQAGGGFNNPATAAMFFGTDTSLSVANPVDVTTTQTVKVTATLSATHASLTCKRYAGSLVSFGA
jgi:hypothetical protein